MKNLVIVFLIMAGAILPSSPAPIFPAGDFVLHIPLSDWKERYWKGNTLDVRLVISRDSRSPDGNVRLQADRGERSDERITMPGALDSSGWLQGQDLDAFADACEALKKGMDFTRKTYRLLFRVDQAAPTPEVYVAWDGEGASFSPEEARHVHRAIR